MSARLFGHAIAGIYQYDGQIAVGCSGDHIASVLHMARRVGDDELAPWSRKIFVSHIYGDALFSFGFQPVGKNGEVGRVGIRETGCAAHRLQLIFKNGVPKAAALIKKSSASLNVGAL